MAIHKGCNIFEPHCIIKRDKAKRDALGQSCSERFIILGFLANNVYFQQYVSKISLIKLTRGTSNGNEMLIFPCWRLDNDTRWRYKDITWFYQFTGQIGTYDIADFKHAFWRLKQFHVEFRVPKDKIRKPWFPFALELINYPYRKYIFSILSSYKHSLKVLRHFQTSPYP